MSTPPRKSPAADVLPTGNTIDLLSPDMAVLSVMADDGVVRPWTDPLLAAQGLGDEDFEEEEDDDLDDLEEFDDEEEDDELFDDDEEEEDDDDWGDEFDEEEEEEL